MTAALSILSDRLLSAAVNGVYQGVLVAAVVGLVLRLAPRTNAATRHAVWFGTLLFVAALLPVHLFLPSRDLPAAPGYSPPGPSLPALGAAPRPTETFADSAPADPPLPAPPPRESAAADPAAPSAPLATVPEATPLDEAVVTASPSSAPGHPLPPRHGPTVLKSLSWKFQTPVRLPHALGSGLLAAWFLLAGLRAGRIARRLWQTRLAKSAASPPSPRLQQSFDTLRRSLAVRRDVGLALSATHRTAVLLGFVHPVVLLPADLEPEPGDDELEHVLRHELAHVARWDDWGNLLQQLIQAALFFDPAVAWAASRLSLEREIACDDHVLHATAARRAYALTLAKAAARMIHCRPLLAPGVSNNHSQLQRRITMILNPHRDRSPRLAAGRLGFFTAATAALAALALAAGPRLALAQSPPAPAPAATPAAAGPAQPALPAPPAAAPNPAPPDYALPASKPAPPAHLNKNLSVEQRLDRIEKILGELQAQERSRLSNPDASLYRHAKEAIEAIDKLHARDQSRRRDPDLDVVNAKPEEVQQILQDWFQRSTTRRRDPDAPSASEPQTQPDSPLGRLEAARRAEAEASQNTIRDWFRFKDRNLETLQRSLRELEKATPEARLQALQALRQAREALQKQLEALNRQLSRLEQSEPRPGSPDLAPSTTREAPAWQEPPDQPAPETK